jgi:hypothetical protein
MKLLALLSLLSSFSSPQIAKIENEKVISYYDMKSGVSADFFLKEGYCSGYREIAFNRVDGLEDYITKPLKNSCEVFYSLKSRYERQEEEISQETK